MSSVSSPDSDGSLAAREEEAMAAIARFYDLDFGGITDDLTLYRELAAGGRVLELGAGTGRVAVALADAGCDVVALEHSAAMRAVAGPRCEAAGARLVDGDMRDFRLPGEAPFDLVVCALSSFCHLPDRAAQLGALRAVAAHLAPDGRLVLDLPALDAGDWEEGARPLQAEWTRRNADGQWVTKLATLRARPAAQAQDVTYIYDEQGGDGQVRRTVARFTLRHVFRFELEGLLEAAGLQLLQTFGSYDLDPAEAGDRLIALAALAGDEGVR